MRNQRANDISQAFVSLAGGLARGSDILDLLSGLTADAAKLLDIASAGLLLADRRGILHVAAASSERTRSLEVFQLQRDQGPCLDCFHDGVPVSVSDLREESERWPEFVEASLAADFASVHALPMRLRNHRLGTLGLFGTSVGPLDDADLRLGQALADVASVAIVQDAAAGDADTVSRQLQAALDSRVVVEQAKGLLSQIGDVEMDETFVLLRDYARSQGALLGDVARSLVDRELPVERVLQPAAVI